MMFSGLFLWILCVSLPVGYGRLLVLVNRVEWVSADDTKHNLNDINGGHVYHYMDGDNIDVSCVSLGERERRRVKLNFDGIEKHHAGYDISDTTKLSLKSGVGLRTTLLAAHDRSNMSCIFSDDSGNATAIMNITFILEKAYNDVLDLKINGNIMRRYNLKMKQRYDILYIDVERFSFECNVHSNDTVLNARLYKRGSWSSLHGSVIKTMPTGNDIIHYEAVYKTTRNTQLIIEIHFALVPDFISNYLLTLNVSANRGLYNWYGFNGVQLINLEYEDGDNLTLNCYSAYTREELMPQKDFYLNFSGSVERKSNSVFKKVRLTPEDDKQIQKCSLYYKENMAGLIQVMFHRISIDDIQGFQYWIPAVAAGCICIVLVAISNIMCYIRSRKRQAREVTSATSYGRMEDPQRDSNDTVVLCAAKLEAQYSVPMPKKHKATTISDLQQRNLGTPCATSTSGTMESSSCPHYAVPDKSDRQ